MFAIFSTEILPSITLLRATTPGWPTRTGAFFKSPCRPSFRRGGEVLSMTTVIQRRRFLTTGLALAAGAGPFGAEPAAGFQNSDIRYGFSGQAWMGESPDGKPWPGNIEEGIREVG